MKTLLLLLLSTVCFAQLDSSFNFKPKDNKLSWQFSKEMPQKDAPTIKEQLIAYLEELDGVEILNSSNLDIIRGKFNGYVLSKKQMLFFSEYKSVLDAEFRIYLKYEGYDVKMSSISVNKAPIEQYNLKSDGKIRASSAPMFKQYDGIFSSIFNVLK